MLNEKIISAVQYYMGKPDGRFFTQDLFDSNVVNAKKAYITLNTIMGGETSERDRFFERKKQIPELITINGINKMIELFGCLAMYAVQTKENSIMYQTVRACRQSEITEGEFIIEALTSTTKLSIEEIMAMGYGDKNSLAICCYNFHKGAMVVDMEKLGEAYLKPEEREVLLITGTRLVSKCLGYDNRYKGKDGEPALVYEVDILPHSKVFLENLNDDKKIVFDEKRICEVRNFFEQLNIFAEFPKYPEEYLMWKNAFKRIVMSEVYKNLA